jgi:imidazolonepropionase-like amidohydrolase
MRISHIAAIAGVAGVVIATSLGAQTIAITGGTVFPVSGPKIEKGTILIKDGKVVAVGAAVVIPAGAKTIDATGKWITPGLINIVTTLGLGEGNVPAQSSGYNDSRSKGDKGVAAGFAAWTGLNPASTFIPLARKGGVTSVGVWPSRGNLIGGKAAIVDLTGESLASMLVKAPIAMMGQFGDPIEARGEAFGRFRDVLSDARAYSLRKAQFESGATRTFAASRADLDALGPVIAGTMPFAIEADRASDIRTALSIAKEFSIKLIILGGAEAWEVAKELAAAKVPVLTGAMSNIPSSFNTLGSRQENAAILRAAGVQVALIGNGGGMEDNYNVRNIRFEAGNAVAYGMSWDDALRAVTIVPAELFGAGNQVGSLQAGREANLVIWSGDPFEIYTVPEHVFIRGAENTALTREEELTQRYKTKPPTYKK